ncbi:MAG: hypothetical protein KDC83_10240 [Flavobacteriales bacterium]|nr:hypothetical protein [Flavobacteriales bacterium]
MLSIFTKKKLSEEKLQKLFVSGILQLVDKGFPDVAELINTDPEFEINPNIQPNDADKFLMIVVAGNLALIPKHFNDYQDVRLIDGIIKQMANVLNIDHEKLKSLVAKYQSFIHKVNMPSKNILYGMSKAVFHKYELNQFQIEYFRNMKSPNPLFIKRLDDIMLNFQWDWEVIRNKYKITE